MLYKKLAEREATATAVRTTQRAEIASRPNWPRTVVLAGGVVLGLLAVFALAWLTKTRRQPRAVADKSVSKKIAVLPFVNLTGDPEQEYFCDGMTEQLITNLSRVPELKVIARTSVMRHKNTEKDIRQISKELDAKYVLEGSVRKSDRRVRITAQLIEAQEGTHLWANDYDRELQDIFAIQDDVSQSIARALEVAFTGVAKRMVHSSYSTNFEAYDPHLKTRYFIDNVYLKTRREQDFQRAAEMAQRTVALDPNHYLGYFDLGYLHEVHRTFTGAPEDAKLTRKYVRQAYRLNPNLPETNAAMALMFFRSGEIDSTISFTKMALARHANTWEPLHLIGTNMAALGLHRQAIGFYNKAIELNPFNMYTHANRGWDLLFVGEVDRALGDFADAYQIQPDFDVNLIGYALALIIKEKWIRVSPLSAASLHDTLR